MKYTALFLFSIIGMLVSSCQHKPATSTLSPLEAITKEKANELQQIFNSDSIGVALMVYTPEKQSFHASGFATPMSEHHFFRGASTTKSFTAASILKMHQEGKLNIDDNLTDFIPGSNRPYIPAEYGIPYQDEITLRMLLAHRGGVFDVTNSMIPSDSKHPRAGEKCIDVLLEEYGANYSFTPKEMLAPIKEWQFSYFQPDDTMHYSNSGYHLLGQIVERISGMSLKAYKESQLMRPFGMKKAYFQDQGDDLYLPQPTVDCFIKINNKLIKMLDDNLSTAYADGNIIATVEDLAKWAYTLWGTNNILADSMLTQMTTPRQTGDFNHVYGLGCGMHPQEIGHGHDGARPSYMVLIRYHPETKKSYVVMTNCLNIDDFGGHGEIMIDAIRQAIAVEREKM